MDLHFRLPALACVKLFGMVLRRPRMAGLTRTPTRGSLQVQGEKIVSASAFFDTQVFNDLWTRISPNR